MQIFTPSPVKDTASGMMMFGQAMDAVVQGKPVARNSWGNSAYLFLRAGFLHVKNADGEHKVVISDGDIVATDWAIIGKVD